jgi:hypothetical protein
MAARVGKSLGKGGRAHQGRNYVRIGRGVKVERRIRGRTAHQETFADAGIRTIDAEICVGRWVKIVP